MGRLTLRIRDKMVTIFSETSVFIRRSVLSLTLLLLLFAGTRSAYAEPEFTVFVVPQFPSEEIFRTWTPLLEDVSRRSGVRLRLIISRSIPNFEAELAKAEPDIAYANPYHAVVAHKSKGYQPIVANSQQKLSGILVVRRDSPMRTVSDLAGSEIAFPSPNAFGASLYIRALLNEREKIAFQTDYVSTHSNVFRSVLNGSVAAGGAIRQTLEKEAPELQSELRVLYETPATEPHPIIVHPRVPKSVAARVQEVFIAMGNDPAGAKLLREIQLDRPKAVSIRDYHDVLRLDLQKYAVSPTR